MDDGFVLVAGNPVPTSARCHFLDVSAGVKLRYGLFPAERTTRATVCLLQGRGECMERNFETIRDLTERGFQVATFDWRGQGGSPPANSPGRHGHVGGFEHYLDDFTKFMLEIVLPDCPPPYLLIGNSLGGHIGLRAVAEHNWFEAAVMVAPFIDTAPSSMPRWLQLGIVRAMTLLGFGKAKVPFYSTEIPGSGEFEGNPLTSDKTRYQRNMRLWQQAPEFAAFAPTVGWVSAAFKSCGVLKALDDTTPLRCPALLVIASKDTVVSNEAIQQFARYVPGAATVSINGAKHDVLCERGTFRDQFLAAFEAFVADRVRK